MKDVLKTIFKKVKLKTLIILLVLLICNTFAWFTYVSRVSGGLTARISSWNIHFQAGGNDEVNDVSFTVGEIYPGMEPYEERISAYNDGEMIATITIEFKSITVFGETYQISSLGDLVQYDFPFTINYIMLSNPNIPPGEYATIILTFNWPFESNNDELDTRWGEMAHEYYLTHPDEPSVIVEIEFKAVQMDV